ncbi:MAG: ABC transporter substrate-binding protein [Ilumatobacteraceae bacterium]
MRRSSNLSIGVLTLTVLMVTAASCTSDATSAPTTIPVNPTVPVRRTDDGVLTIGVLIPQGSANADIGEAIRSATELAKDKINAAGGYRGQGVVLVPEDEGVLGVGIDPAIASLLDSNVDAIIGPASSTNALAGLGEIIDAGVVACSPTASASLLDDFPDHDLFFRTIPSDSLQAIAIAEAVDNTGASGATISYIDDAFGQRFADAVAAALVAKRIEQSNAVPFSADNASIKTAAQEVAQIAAGVVVVIGDAASGPVMLGAIDAADGNRMPLFVVNDAIRRPAASAEPMSASLARRVKGISPIAFSTDATFLEQVGATPDNPSPFAANAFDCFNLIALAATASNSTQPAAIAAAIPGVSDSGSPCTNFAACRDEILLGNNINYDGPGGQLTINGKGELAGALFESFGFNDATGRDEHRGFVAVRP